MYAIEKVGTIVFGNHRLDVYDNVDEPLFKAVDVARLIDYSIGNTWKMLEVCETDEKLQLPLVVAGQRRNVKGELMKDILTTIFALMIIVTVILWTVAIALGGVEILWWIFTGDFFHFVSNSAATAF